MKQVTDIRFVFPRIGMRIIKSAIAVLICYIVNILRGGSGMVFYSQLAALWCIQMYRSNTIKNAIQRSIGTVVGAVFGLVYVLMYPFVETVSYADIIEAFLVALFIMVVLYATVLLKKQQASYFSCVVFLSIVVNHVGDLNPYLFVWKRFLDTVIGIVIGVIVNDFRISFHPDRETLFVSGLDETLLDQKEMLSPYSRVELNRMIEDGLQFTVSTVRTPASILEPMQNVNLKLPVIAMDGAALYDVNKNAYLKTYVISAKTARQIMYLISKYNVCWYANIIIDDTLLIYYGDTEDEVNKRLVENLRTSAFRNYIRRPLPYEENVTYFMLLDKAEKIDQFMSMLIQENYYEQLKIVTYPSRDFEGYSYIKIYNHNAKKENMIAYLKQITGLNQVVTFGTILDKYDVVVDENDGNRVVHEVRRRYEMGRKKSDGC